MRYIVKNHAGCVPNKDPKYSYFHRPSRKDLNC